eukprot:CAMPEP_0170069610 /NCGR_PEP_ID=MMETSP0019_2-20121128/8219_1 /TAXON_ID=98059 /ORGANISM="Dinobryon sp., Strain UTEXLB2267" /LENGTH=273 /DNA_ID=CAMNT_0010277695 /DNA_START=275 /DNA_END=1096 /DNA_ORIENTATION=+
MHSTYMAPAQQGRTEDAFHVLLSMEQPKYAVVLNQRQYLMDKFDLLMTYSLRDVYPGTDIPNLPITYFPLNIVSVNAVLHAPRSFKEKDGHGQDVWVAIFASNCKAAGASSRYAYLEELMKLIKVHSYGKCLHNIDEPPMGEDKGWPEVAQRRARKVKVLSKYKFYLAFENAPVEDYVSEKVFEGLFAGSLPVYRGASTIHRFMPSNSSYIDANNMTPKDLAKKLQFLANNEMEYNKYFTFKTQPLSEEFKQIALMSYTHPNVLCRLCEYVVK